MLFNFFNEGINLIILLNLLLSINEYLSSKFSNLIISLISCIFLNISFKLLSIISLLNFWYLLGGFVKLSISILTRFLL